MEAAYIFAVSERKDGESSLGFDGYKKEDIHGRSVVDGGDIPNLQLKITPPHSEHR